MFNATKHSSAVTTHFVAICAFIRTVAGLILYDKQFYDGSLCMFVMLISQQ